MKRNCTLCKKEIVGRKDKRFCSINCKNEYHSRLRQATKEATIPIDKILHRNRSILLEIMGKNEKQKKVPRHILDQKKFNIRYMTGFFENAQGKRYHIVYDFAWMEFSDGEVLIKRRN